MASFFKVATILPAISMPLLSAVPFGAFASSSIRYCGTKMPGTFSVIYFAILADDNNTIPANMAKYMTENVPGIFVPQYLIDEMAIAPKGQALNKGIEIAGRMITTLKK